MDSTLTNLAGLVRQVLGQAIDLVEDLRGRLRPRPEPLPPVLLALEVRRLAEELRALEDSDAPHKAERLAARTMAYDLALRDYCRALQIPVPPGHRGFSRDQRFELETALISSGNDW